MNQRITAGQAMVETLCAHGVDTVFGIPGVQTYPLFDALARSADRVRLINPRHEQTCAYMAFGYARSTGREGVYSVVPGPGVLNSGAALVTAYGASAPVLCLTGEVPASFLGRGLGHLHEMPDQLALLNGLTKWATRIDHADACSEQVTEAFRQMRSGRPRPAAVSMPWDVFAQTTTVPLVTPFAKPAPQAADSAEVEKAAAMLARARNPMIMVGSGAAAAGADVLRLAELLQAPVVSFRSGRGVVSDEHALGFTCAAGYRRWDDTDVVIGIGTRMELAWFRWPRHPGGLQLISIDVDPRQPVRLQADIGLVGDAGRTAALLADLLEKSPRRASRHAEFAQLKNQVAHDIRKIQPQMDFLAAIRDVLPRDGFIAEESSQAGFASIYGIPMYEPRTFISSGHQGTLGYGFPTCLGVKVGNPDKCVVSITGDGGFMFGIQELTTAVEHRINLVTVLFNNQSYGNVLRDQQRLYEGRDIAARLLTPDFGKVADAFGTRYFNAATPAALRAALEQAFAADAPCLVEVPIPQGSETSPWEFITPQRQPAPRPTE
jgi:acetolactate synthase-1/2/3 large subunit